MIGLGVKQKSSFCMYHEIMDRFGMEEQLSGSTFQHLCFQLRGCLQLSSTVCAAIPVEKRIAIA